MACHPETRQESDGELENEGRNMGRESDEAQVDHLTMKQEMVENVIQHPLQSQIQAAATRITKQLKAYHFAEWRIEEVDDRGQRTFNP